jgi:hypothetical protein
MASTLLNEQGFPPDVIELQLAHSERNKVRAAYNKAQRLPERRKMMQAWADYFDRLRAGATVVPIRRHLPWCIHSDTLHFEYDSAHCRVRSMARSFAGR